MVARRYNRRVLAERTKAATEDFSLGIDGVRLAARSLTPLPAPAADSPTLVFLHEGLGSIEGWRSFPTRLVAATGLPALLFDRRGYGGSDPLDRPWGIGYLHRAALEELPAVLAACSIERPLLIGHSDGGTIALLFAAHHRPAAVVTEAAHIFVEQAARDGIDRTVHRWRHGDLRRRLERFHGPQTEAIFRSWADTWRAPWFDDWTIVEELRAVTCPALLLQGAEDEYATPEHLDEIARRLSGPVEAELLAGCGHAPHLDRPDLVIGHIVRWLAAQQVLA